MDFGEQRGNPDPAMSEMILLRPESSVELLAGTGFNPSSGEGEYLTGPMEGVRISLAIPHDVEPAFASPNVVGLVPGTDPVLKDDYIVVTAHLDHLGVRNGDVFNGADDNASGSAAVLEVAEAMAVNPGRRSVLFVLLTGEEMGLLGAFAFAGNPPVPTEDMVLNINLDMVGRNSPSFPDAVLALASENEKARLLEIVREVNRIADDPLDLSLNEGGQAGGYLERSDQFAFIQKGIPAILITRGFTGPDYHRPTDDPETINYRKVLHAAKSTLALVQDVANRKELGFERNR
jgi:Zn-dependent M28 family amino/carboxypeptidase